MIFKTFPDNPDLYNTDIKPIVEETIERYGNQEWLAGVVTTLMHGHLGVYAIVGVKMGVKALEYLGVEVGELNILSFAGTNPPVSCMNDGLQVSTGATLGHGLIESASTNTPLTEIIVSSAEKTIHVKVKEDVSCMIKQEIAGAVKQYGHSPDYWEYVRNLAVKYWKDLDRNSIFEIIEK